MKKLMLCGVFLSVCAFPALADVISTGSDKADSILQWLTSIVTIASIIANVTPTPVDNGGVKILSLLINIAAANWKQIKEAWSGSDQNNLKGLVLIPFALLISMSAQNADAATQIKFSCTAPVTREDGSALDASMLAGFKLYKNATAVDNKVEPVCANLVYAIVPGACVLKTDVFTVTAIDTSGNESKFSNAWSLTQNECRPYAKPSPPTGLNASAI